ncbi:AAA family ATPase [Pseudodesulfovibrio senegalensis]|nr:AAA family ATPase [Pseudodesulfovibrio senegalensis]
MIRKIILENFMAHKHTELELGPGLTALTGPNNTGKSAVVEALRCVATNPSPYNYIRHGAKQARVTVELEDGVRVVWIRKKASPGYEIHRPGQDEPEEFWKMGRGNVPDEVRDLLRLDPVELERFKNDAVDVHIGNQREPVFLLNRPDSLVADFLASSTEGAHLLSMQDALKKRITEAKREQAGRTARLGHIRTELDTLSPLPDLTLLAETCREMKTQLRTLDAAIPALGSLLHERDRLEKQRVHAQRSAQALANLTPPPELEPVAPLANTLNEQAALHRRLQTASAQAKTLAPLNPPPQVHDTRTLRTLVDSLQTVADGLIRSEKRHAILNGLLDPPQPDSPAPLQALLRDMGALQHRLGQAQVELERAKNEKQAFRAQLDERLAGLGTCPTCGQPMDAGHFLQEVGEHES